MAESSISEARKEAAFQSFVVEFTRNGFQVPEGLMRLLREYNLKPGESNHEGRARLYKRLWCILWYGSKNTLGSGIPGFQPTYVYPATLKAVIREIIPGKLVDRPDPTHMGVYKVNIGDLSEASWPPVKKGRNKKNDLSLINFYLLSVNSFSCNISFSTNREIVWVNWWVAINALR